METTTIPGTDVATTRLGFGGSNLLGNKTPAEGLRLLEAAFEAGIRHFDVAPYYGFGAAESLLGEFAQRRRSDITITTKFGIQPPGTSGTSAKGAALRLVLPLARRLIRRSSGLRRLAKARVSASVTRGAFSVDSAKKSLENSLLELKTDYIDILLLHDCEPSECTPELLRFLEESLQEGKIRAFGVGTSPENVRTILDENESFGRIVQFHDSFERPTLDGVLPRLSALSTPGLCITHGALAKARKVQELFNVDPSLAASIADELGTDPADPALLPGLILQRALNRNADGIVLFRTESLHRIGTNVLAATKPFGAERIRRAALIVESALAVNPESFR